MTASLAHLGGGDWLPAASSFAPRVDHVMEGLLLASLAVITVLTVLTLVILVRYRRGTKVSRAPIGIATWKIETAWTTATLAIFLFFFIQGAASYLEMRRIPEGAKEINVVGRQWMWDVRYPDGRREFNTLHVRLNQPVRLLLSSEDVIHSFFVPAFRLKQDLVPGKVVDAWFNPTRVGTYPLFCAQFCGTAHAEMIGKVVVLAPDQYSEWEEGKVGGEGAGSASSASAGRGKSLFLQYGCATCHNDPSGTRAPSLAGVYQSLVRLNDGRFMRADEQFLHDAILLSPKYVVAGYALKMPTYQGLIGEADVLDLIAYLKAQGAVPPQTAPSKPAP